MRNIDTNILAQLESNQIRPFFLVHFNIDSTDYSHTDCDVPIAYAGTLYTPKGFNVSDISYSLNNIVDQANLEIDILEDSALAQAFIAGDPQGSAIDISMVVLDSTYQIVAEPEELVSNGAFASDTVWTKGTGWTITAGVASSDGTQTDVSDLYQDALPEIGSCVQIIYTVSNWSAGTIKAMAGTNSSVSRFADGTYTDNIIVAGNTNIIFRADADFVGDIDNVSVKQVGKLTLFQGEIGEWTLSEGKIDLTMTNQFSRWNQQTLSNHSASCRWKVFKGTECTYSGAETWCDRSYERCLVLANSANFGGFRFLPSIEKAVIKWGTQE